MNKIHKVAEGIYAFHCPACGHAHPFHVPRWTWNGSLDKPTFTPSLRCLGDDGKKTTCHLWMTDGKIHFCNDCPHAMVNKVVECPDWDDQLLVEFRKETSAKTIIMEFPK